VKRSAISTVDRQRRWCDGPGSRGLAPPDLVGRGGPVDPAQLERELINWKRRGRPVIAVVARAPATPALGGPTPDFAIAAVCRRHGVWLHVDGAIGGCWR